MGEEAAKRAGRAALIWMFASVAVSFLVMQIWPGGAMKGVIPSGLPALSSVALGIWAIVAGVRTDQIDVQQSGLAAVIFGIIHFFVVGGIIGLAHIS